MKRISIFLVMLLISCDMNKEKRESLANEIALVKQSEQQLSQEIESLTTIELGDAEQALNYLETTEYNNLERESESTNSMQFLRTVEEKEEDIQRLQAHIDDYQKKLKEAKDQKEIILQKIKIKKDSLRQLEEIEIDYQRQLDMLK